MVHNFPVVAPDQTMRAPINFGASKNRARVALIRRASAYTLCAFQILWWPTSVPLETWLL